MELPLHTTQIESRPGVRNGSARSKPLDPKQPKQPSSGFVVAAQTVTCQRQSLLRGRTTVPVLSTAPALSRRKETSRSGPDVAVWTSGVEGVGSSVPVLKSGPAQWTTRSLSRTVTVNISRVRGATSRADTLNRASSPHALRARVSIDVRVRQWFIRPPVLRSTYQLIAADSCPARAKKRDVSCLN
jgi:hypothetical protein